MNNLLNQARAAVAQGAAENMTETTKGGGDSAYNFLKELNLSPANLDFLEDCYNQDWKRDEYHEPEE